jgi:polysaccharide biosynthesis protein PslH
MRIAFVVPNVPSPIRPRPFNLIRTLSRIHQVSVLCLVSNDADERSIADLRPYCHSLEVFRVSRWRSIWNCIRALLSSRSVRCAYFYSPFLRRRVEQKVIHGEIDLVHAEHLKSVPMVETVVGKVPVVFDAVDCISMFEKRRRKVIRNPLLKAFSWIESKKMAFGEARATELFNRVVICSDVDKESYPARRDRIDVIISCVDLKYFSFKEFQPWQNRLVLCGKFDYFPNEDAAVYFTRSIWPLLRRRRPHLELDIIGSRPPQSIRQLHGQENIHVAASVPDLRPYLGRAWVSLSPVRIRAGIQTKIIEAMALGVPVVAHGICCEGLRVQPGRELLVAETPEQFASAVELLLDNHAVRDSLVNAGRNYVEQYHDWDKAMLALCNSYSRAMEDFSGSTDVADTYVSQI